MSKIGVGIGEDFPVDDGQPRESRQDDPRREGYQGEYRPRGEGRDYDAEYAARHEAYRNWREQRREWKRQWRDEWRARRRDFRDQFKDSYYDGYRRPYWGFGHPFYWGARSTGRIIAIVAVVAIVALAFSHIYLILGGLVLLALFAAAYHRGYDPFDLPQHRYDRPEQSPPPAQPRPPAEPPRDSAH